MLASRLLSQDRRGNDQRETDSKAAARHDLLLKQHEVLAVDKVQIDLWIESDGQSDKFAP